MESAAKPELYVVEDPLTGFDGELSKENIDLLARRVMELDGNLRGAVAQLADNEAEMTGQDRTIRSLGATITKLKGGTSSSQTRQTRGSRRIALPLRAVMRTGVGTGCP